MATSCFALSICRHGARLGGSFILKSTSTRRLNNAGSMLIKHLNIKGSTYCVFWDEKIIKSNNIVKPFLDLFLFIYFLCK